MRILVRESREDKRKELWFTIDVSLYDTVEMVLSKIYSQPTFNHGYHCTLQYLGDLLQDDDQLSKYGIKEDSELFMRYKDEGTTICDSYSLSILSKAATKKTFTPMKHKLEETYDQTICSINDGTCKVPSAVNGIQFMRSKQRVYVYCDSDEIETGTQFARERFVDDSNFVVYPTTAPEYLSLCFRCNEPNCPSKTGAQRDIGCKDWIGPGSHVLAIKTDMWKKIQANKIPLFTLNDVREQHSIVHEEDKTLRFIEEWTMGCHMKCDNTKHVVLTVAHPLVDLEPGTNVTFLTQARNERNESEVQVIGEHAKGFFSKTEAIDILLIDINNQAALRLMKTKVKKPCNYKYINVEPEFRCHPELGTGVTKRGITSGNTFGKVITDDKYYVINHQEHGYPKQQAAGAFAVSSTETRCVPKSKFALGGDSGSLVLECDSSSRNPKAYGMVWCRKPVCSAIEGEDVDASAIVCVKTNNCLKFVDDYFKMKTEFQRISSSMQVNSVNEATRSNDCKLL